MELKGHYLPLFLPVFTVSINLSPPYFLFSFFSNSFLFTKPLWLTFSSASPSLSPSHLSFSRLWQQCEAALNLVLFGARSCLPSPVVSWLDCPPLLAVIGAHSSQLTGKEKAFPKQSSSTAWRLLSQIPCSYGQWGLPFGQLLDPSFPIWEHWVWKAQIWKLAPHKLL